MPGDAASQLLAILALPVAAGLACLFVFILQNAANRHGVAPSPPAANPSETFNVFSIADAYDAESCVLWESQILLLQRINARASMPELLELWSRYVHLYPELYEQISFWKWLVFLESCNLIESHGNGVLLTAYGCELLRYLTLRARTEEHRTRHS